MSPRAEPGQLAAAETTLHAGWYLVEGLTALIHGRPARGLWLIAEPGSIGGAFRRVPIAASATDGRWSCVVAVHGGCRRFRLETQEAPVVAGTELHVRRLGRLEAAIRMLAGLTTPAGLPDLRAMSRVAGAALRRATGSSGASTAEMLSEMYVAACTDSQPAEAMSPWVVCQLRTRPWLARWRAIRLYPAGDLHADPSAEHGDAWRAVANDPQLSQQGDLQPPLPGGWYRFRAHLRVHEGEINSPCLYPDYGSGAEQGTHIPLPWPDANGEISAVVLFRQDVRGLRFDPSIRPVGFRLDHLRVQRLSRLGAAFRMLRSLRSDQGFHWPELREAISEALSAFASKGAPEAGEALHRHYKTFLWSDSADYGSWVRLYDSFTPSALRLLGERAETLQHGPLISVLLPVYNTPERWLRRCIDSVIAQAYPHWELCIADDASSAAHVRQVLREYQQRDTRIRVVLRPGNGHIAEASNSALELAGGQFVGLLDHDDELRPHALLEVAETLLARPDARLVYSDEDKIDGRGRRFEPNFKPDWNPDLLLSQNYVCHFTVIDTALVRSLGGFRAGFEGSQDHDLILRCSETLEANQVVHIPKVLYHWRAIDGSTALRRDAKDYAADAGARAVTEHLSRSNAAARVDQLPHGHYRVRWDLPEPAPRVSLVIPTRDKVHLLRKCVQSILHVTQYPSLELLIVDNQSTDPEALAYLNSIAEDSRVTVLRYDAEFNYSAINNFAVARASGSVIGLVNNDIEVLSADWIRELASQALRPGIGAVGTMLHYPDGSIQHAGVVLGIGGIANHPYAHQPRGYPGHGARALVAQNLSAVTGACLFVTRSSYEQVGGLDENLAVAFNDIDFCLRLRALGYRNLWTPFADIVHHESASRGAEDTDWKRARFQREVDFMHERWGAELYADPAYNPNLSLQSINFELAFPPRDPSSPTAG